MIVAALAAASMLCPSPAPNGGWCYLSVITEKPADVEAHLRLEDKLGVGHNFFISGVVENKGPRPYEYLHVKCKIYDQAHRIIGAAEDLVEQVGEGEAGNVHAYIFDADTLPTHFSCKIIGARP